jgi:hypothetical protein
MQMLFGGFVLRFALRIIMPLLSIEYAMLVDRAQQLLFSIIQMIQQENVLLIAREGIFLILQLEDVLYIARLLVIMLIQQLVNVFKTVQMAILDLMLRKLVCKHVVLDTSLIQYQNIALCYALLAHLAIIPLENVVQSVPFQILLTLQSDYACQSAQLDYMLIILLNLVLHQ